MPQRSAGILAEGPSSVSTWPGRGSSHNDCCAVAMHATTQPTVALWRVRGQGRSRRCRPCVTHAAQGGEAPSSGGAPRKLTPLPADFGERCVAGLPQGHTRRPRSGGTDTWRLALSVTAGTRKHVQSGLHTRRHRCLQISELSLVTGEEALHTVRWACTQLLLSPDTRVFPPPARRRREVDQERARSAPHQRLRSPARRRSERLQWVARHLLRPSACLLQPRRPSRACRSRGCLQQRRCRQHPQQLKGAPRRRAVVVEASSPPRRKSSSPFRSQPSRR